jgi:ATP-dependent DNA helicase RecG
LVLNGEMSRPQLIAILELKNSPHFATNYLDPAIKDGLIEMTLPEKLKSKNQKYRLTPKGLKLKGNLKIPKTSGR